MSFLKGSRKGAFFNSKMKEIVVLPCEFFNKQV